MIELKDLLSKYNNILFSEESKRESMAKIIGGVIGLSIQRKDVKIKNNNIYLNIKPIYKNEIFLKKDKIDKLLEIAFGQRPPTVK